MVKSTEEIQELIKSLTEEALRREGATEEPDELPYTAAPARELDPEVDEALRHAREVERRLDRTLKRIS